MMKYLSLLCCLFFHVTLHAKKPVIVVLMGGSSVGKTSIGKALKSLDSNWCIIDEDDVYIGQWIAMVSKMFPWKFAAVAKAIAPCNLFHAIKRNEILFYESADEKERSQAYRAIEYIQHYFSEDRIKNFKKKFHKKFQRLFNKKIKTGLKEGKNVLIDCLGLKPQQIKAEFPDFHVITALVFCSLSSCDQHLKKRNKDAFANRNLRPKRSLSQVIPTYIKFYRLTSHSGNAIAQYNTCDVELFFEQISKEIAQNKNSYKSGFIVKELDCAMLNRLRNELIPKIFTQKLFLEAKNKYDIIINTDILNPQQAADLLLNKIKSVSY